MRIPEYQSKGAPTPQARDTSAPLRALHGIGQEILQAGEHYQRIQTAKKSSDLSNALAYSSVERMKAKADIERNPANYQTAEERYSQTEKSINEYVKKNHSDIYSLWQQKDIEEATKAKIDIGNFVNKNTIDNIRANGEVTQNLWVDYSVNKGTDADILYATKQYSDSISRDLQSGAISQVEYQEKISEFGIKVSRGILTRDIRVDPAGAMKKLESGYYRTSAVDTQEYMVKAQSEFEAQEKEIVRKKEKADKELEAEIKKIKEDNAVAITADVSETGIIDMPNLRQMLREGEISRQFFDSMQARETEGPKKSDLSEYNRLRSKAEFGSASVEELTENPFISHSDANSLINLNVKAKEDSFKNQLKNGQEYLRSIIVTTGPLSQYLNEGEAERLQNAEKELQTRMVNGEKYEKVMEDMSKRYRTEATLSIKSLPVLGIPGLTVRPQDKQDIEMSLRALFIAVKNGTISQDDAKYNAELIGRYNSLIEIGAQ